MPQTIYRHTAGSKLCFCRPNAGGDERACTSPCERWSWWWTDLILLSPCLNKCGGGQETGGAPLRSLQTGPMRMLQVNCAQALRSWRAAWRMAQSPKQSKWAESFPLCMFSALHIPSPKETGRGRAKLIITSRSKTHSMWSLRLGATVSNILHQLSPREAFEDVRWW